jgi:asparagine synthase (glutamine-hydrolysing)
MCGITGAVALIEAGKSQLDFVENAVSRLSKRGPDYQATQSFANAKLGHARLSIIDTSTSANQPFTDSTGRYTIVFNGEIFNYLELRKTLLSDGTQFRTESDTEVLLTLFIRKKEKCLNLLNGFFAFAVYDALTQELFLARDRFGVKPLHYFFNNEFFCFASELKALRCYDIPKEIDHASLYQFFHLNYLPQQSSIYKGVKKLLPGTYLKIKSSTVEPPVTYYQVQTDFSPKENVVTYQNAKVQFKTLLTDAVRVRLRSDVPFGAFLSGGIDSSAVTSLAAKEVSKLNTFSIGFSDAPQFDETYYAELIARKYQTNHTTFKVSKQDLYESLFKSLDYIDEPFADSSALAVNILCELTRKNVTVALSGDGADEMFAGYNKHAAEYFVQNSKLKANLASKAFPLLKNLPGSRNSKMGNLIRQMKKLSKTSSLEPKERYWHLAGFYHENIPPLFVSNIQNDRKALNEWQNRKDLILSNLSNTNPDMNQVLITDMNLVLGGDMLTKVDLMSMANSLEVRNPFLDYRVVDFAFSLPQQYKIDSKQRKKILVETFSDLLPNELLTRKKQGFEVPLLDWFRGELKSLICNDLLSKSFIEEQGIFNHEAINQLIKQLFSSNPDDAVAKIYALIVFQYWWKNHHLS